MQSTSQTNALPTALQPLGQEILAWLQAHPHDPNADPSPYIAQIEAWQAQLQDLAPDFHILWCLAPHLCLRLGPSRPIAPFTPWLGARLEDVRIASLDEELISWGTLTSDTMLSVTREGWRIDTRPTIYREQLAGEAHLGSKHGLWSLFDDPEDILLWRQELNLAHEWGHMYVESHIPYQEPLLERLTPYHPSQGALIFSWFEALLEGLAEATPQQGALSFLADLGGIENHRLFAATLLWERAQEFAQPGNDATNAIRAQLLGWILPGENPPPHTTNTQETSEYLTAAAQTLAETHAAFVSHYDQPEIWGQLQTRVDEGGDLLQTILMETINLIDLIPPKDQSGTFLQEMFAHFQHALERADT